MSHHWHTFIGHPLYAGKCDAPRSTTNAGSWPSLEDTPGQMPCEKRTPLAGVGTGNYDGGV